MSPGREAKRTYRGHRQMSKMRRLNGEIGSGLPKLLFIVARRQQPLEGGWGILGPDSQGRPMKNTAVGAAVIGVLLGTPALAADMAVKAPPPASVASTPYSWTGIYIGINGGYARSTETEAISVFNNLGATAGPWPGFSSKGDFFGGQVGFNYQYNWVVVGAEADLQSTHLNSINPPLFLGANFATSQQTLSQFETLRGRIGVAYDRILIYGTGGIAEEHLNDTYTVNGVATSLIINHPQGTSYGGGIEWAFADQLSIKFEYQHLHFKGFLFPPAPVLPPNGIILFNPNPVNTGFDTFRVGLNYKFGLPPAAHP